MRLRIAHQLSLLLATAVVLAVLVVGVLSVWNLRSGFADYLRQRDQEQLTRLLKLVERRAAANGGMEWLRGDREAMRELMDEFTGRQGRGRPPGPPGFDPQRPRPDRLLPPPPGQMPPAGNFPERVQILDAHGGRLAGREPPPGVERSIRAVKMEGVTVATIVLAAEPEPDGVDAHFLQRQYSGLALVALGTIAISVLAALWVAGRWSRPLRALQLASRDIASGRRTTRLQPTGALEIAQLMEDVNSMTAELERLESARRIWIAQISHELRTPLSVLRGEIESIEDGARQPTAAVISNLRDEVLQLGRLVDDLHTLSVADLQGLPCNFVDGDADTALRRVCQRFEAPAQERGLQLVFPLAAASPILVRWDFGRIEQLMGNLLSNCLRYTARPGSVHVAWSPQGQELVLTVDDTPPGVNPSDLGQLFEPLFRADRARQRDGAHGSGLGLSIVRSIVQAHRGTVQASASARGGLRISVRLPLQADGQTP